MRALFLVGLMGAGKTTVGRRLAKRLGWDFVDSDHELEARCGVPVATVFELEGEAGFRKRESVVIDDLTQRSQIVLATGGGAVLRPENRQFLARGTVIYLRATVDELYRRTRYDRNRPLLQTSNPKARLAELLAVRGPIYEECAQIVVDTGSQSVGAVLEALCQKLQCCGPVHDDDDTGEVE